jgi:hypothetical protein
VAEDTYYIEESLCSVDCLKGTEKITPTQAAKLAVKLNLDLSRAEIGNGRRHGALQALVGETFPKLGRPLAKALAEFFFTKASGTQECREWGEHHAEFNACWDWMLAEKFAPTLTADERRIYEGLTEETWRDAFRIARNFAWADARSDERKGAFGVSVESMGMRLIVERAAASKIVKRLVAAGALQKVAPHRPKVRAAIYRWLPCDQPTLAAIRNDLDGYVPTENCPF